MPPKRPKPLKRSSTPAALPPCEGPKLQAFHEKQPHIEWLERLDQNRDEDSFTHSFVFKVRIRSKLYALKVFKFFNPEDSRMFWEPIVGTSFPREQISFHIDPFFAECRAYGKIMEAQRNGKLKQQLVIPCRGFIFLSDKDKKSLEMKGYDLGEDCLDSTSLTNLNTMARALVKDLATDNPGIHSKNLKKVLKDLRMLNELQIFNLDIRMDNYRDGKLVDFGSSWTEQHYILDALDDESAAEYRTQDLVMFDQMVADAKFNTVIRARPNPRYMLKLRSQHK